MDYVDMLRCGVLAIEIREYLVAGDMTVIAIRILRNLRDSAKKVAELRGTSFSVLIRECMINELVGKGE